MPGNPERKTLSIKYCYCHGLVYHVFQGDDWVCTHCRDRKPSVNERVKGAMNATKINQG